MPKFDISDQDAELIGSALNQMTQRAAVLIMAMQAQIDDQRTDKKPKTSEQTVSASGDSSV